MSQAVHIVEVGPRDGLQNEKATIPTAAKVAMVDALSDAGLGEIEVSAFVSPKWVPQLSDAQEVFSAIHRRPGIIYSALVPNEKGLERALRARVGKVCVFTAASETFNQKNINTSIQGSLERFAPVISHARKARLPVRAYVSTAFWCPYEGRIDPAAVSTLVERLLKMDVDEVSIGDTIGKADVGEVNALLEQLVQHHPPDLFAMHFHDTFGQALDNARASFRRGIRRFDASVGGIGGCPYAPGATGNVATEPLARALIDEGADITLNFGALERARESVREYLSQDLPQDMSPT